MTSSLEGIMLAGGSGTSSNNLRPYQYPESVIPLFIANAVGDRPLPLHGDGKNIRDWLHVLDNCSGIDLALREGRVGEVYNSGGGNEMENIALTRQILRSVGKPETLIQRVKDRPGHDRRYSVEWGKIRELGWAPRRAFVEALASTVTWYRNHDAWWRPLTSGDFRTCDAGQYGDRPARSGACQHCAEFGR